MVWAVGIDDLFIGRLRSRNIGVRGRHGESLLEGWDARVLVLRKREQNVWVSLLLDRILLLWTGTENSIPPCSDRPPTRCVAC